MYESYLAKKLITKIIAYTAVLVILFSAVIGFITYGYEMRRFEKTFLDIETSYLNVIREALWIDDEETLRTILAGICRLPGIAYADIHGHGLEVCKAGSESKNNLSKFYDISYKYKDKTQYLGQLHVQGDQGYLYSQILRSIITLLLSQIAIIAAVCVLLFVLIYKLIIRSLLDVTRYASSLSYETLDNPLVLSGGGENDDELYKLANSLNSMRVKLHESFEKQKKTEVELKIHQEHLEKIVQQRTLALTEANEELQEEIDERKQLEKEREELIDQLRTSLDEIKTLRGFVPICANCKNIRDDQGYWQQVEKYVEEHSEAQFSHSICPECMKKLYPEFLTDK